MTCVVFSVGKDGINRVVDSCSQGGGVNAQKSNMCQTV